MLMLYSKTESPMYTFISSSPDYFIRDGRQWYNIQKMTLSNQEMVDVRRDFRPSRPEVSDLVVGGLGKVVEIV